MSDSLDLDFQDYTPTVNVVQVPETAKQSSVSVKIPSSANVESKRTDNQGSVLNLLQNVVGQGSSTINPGISNETLQQILWLNEKQRSKHQRESIAATGSWGLGYFAQYFDVTSDDVLQRILWSAIPLRKLVVDMEGMDDSDLILPLADQIPSQSSPTQSQADRFGATKKRLSYMERFIQSRPDLYGPFWISTTLIFAIAIIANIVRFIDFKEKHDQRRMNSLSSSNPLNLSLSEDLEWHYSMDELNTSASVIMFYVMLLPIFLSFLFWFRGCAKYYTITETICAYGYSLSIFIPVSALLVIQVSIFRYFIISLASAISGMVLVMSFLPIIKSDPNPAGSYIILVVVASCQLGLSYIIHRILSIR